MTTPSKVSSIARLVAGPTIACVVALAPLTVRGSAPPEVMATCDAYTDCTSLHEVCNMGGSPPYSCTLCTDDTTDSNNGCPSTLTCNHDTGACVTPDGCDPTVCAEDYGALACAGTSCVPCYDTGAVCATGLTCQNSDSSIPTWGECLPCTVSECADTNQVCDLDGCESDCDTFQDCGPDQACEENVDAYYYDMCIPVTQDDCLPLVATLDGCENCADAAGGACAGPGDSDTDNQCQTESYNWSEDLEIATYGECLPCAIDGCYGACTEDGCEDCNGLEDYCPDGDYCDEDTGSCDPSFTPVPTPDASKVGHRATVDGSAVKVR